MEEGKKKRWRNLWKVARTKPLADLGKVQQQRGKVGNALHFVKSKPFRCNLRNIAPNLTELNWELPTRERSKKKLQSTLFSPPEDPFFPAADLRIRLSALAPSFKNVSNRPTILQQSIKGLFEHDPIYVHLAGISDLESFPHKHKFQMLSRGQF